MIDIIDRARDFAIKKHSGQKRKSGGDYVNHPLMVGELVMKYKKSKNIKNLIAAAYLHDTLEDTDTTYYELVDLFGYCVASLVMEVTTNEDMKKALGKKQYLSFKLKNMTNWALVIKLCDRLQNVSDLMDVDDKFRNRYIEETVFIIDYLEENRALTKTHRLIINDIRKCLKEVINKKVLML